MRIIARLDIKGEHVVKGVCFEGIRKIGDPKKFCKKYYDDGADEILITDVVASLYGRNNLFQFIEKITEDIFIPICLNGGIRSLDDIDKAIRSGADKVAINSALIKDLSFLKKAGDKFGVANILVSIETKKISNDFWEIYILSGREKTGINLLDWLKEIKKIKCGEILITSIDKDGTESGFDYELAKIIEKMNLKIPLIFSGGCKDMGDVKKIKENFNFDGIAVGSALHYKNLNINKIKKYLDNEK